MSPVRPPEIGGDDRGTRRDPLSPRIRPSPSTARASDSGPTRAASSREPGRPASTRHAAITWAQGLKLVFRIDIETCETCGGKMKVIASIEDPAVIKRILAHLDHRQSAGQHPRASTPGPASTRIARSDAIGRGLTHTHGCQGHIGLGIEALALSEAGCCRLGPVGSRRRHRDAAGDWHHPEFPPRPLLSSTSAAPTIASGGYQVGLLSDLCSGGSLQR